MPLGSHFTSAHRQDPTQSWPQFLSLNEAQLWNPDLGQGLKLLSTEGSRNRLEGENQLITSFPHSVLIPRRALFGRFTQQIVYFISQILSYFGKEPLHFNQVFCTWPSPNNGGSDGKESARSAGDLDSIPGSGRYPGGGHSNPLQYSYLENSSHRGALWATVQGVTKSWTWLSD